MMEELPSVSWNRCTPSGVTDVDHVKSLIDLIKTCSTFKNEFGATVTCDLIDTSGECEALLSAVGNIQTLKTYNWINGKDEWIDLLDGQWIVESYHAVKDEILIGFKRELPIFVIKIKLENFI